MGPSFFHISPNMNIGSTYVPPIDDNDDEDDDRACWSTHFFAELGQLFKDSCKTIDLIFLT